MTISRTLSDGRVLNPADYRVALHTTLNRLRPPRACKGRYEHLLRALGGPSFDHEAPINLLTILEHNGADDCLWALRTAIEPRDQVARLMAADFAEMVLPIFERDHPDDLWPRRAIEAARRFALGEIDAAALAVARYAARYAARAAWAASAAAASSAWGAAIAAALAVQEQIIREYLLPDPPAIA